MNKPPRTLEALMQALFTEVYLGVEEAGLILGLKRSSAYAAVRDGQLPYVRIRHKIIVPTAAIRTLLQMNEPLPRERNSDSGAARLPPPPV